MHSPTGSSQASHPIPTPSRTLVLPQRHSRQCRIINRDGPILMPQHSVFNKIQSQFINQKGASPKDAPFLFCDRNGCAVKPHVFSFIPSSDLVTQCHSIIHCLRRDHIFTCVSPLYRRLTFISAHTSPANCHLFASLSFAYATDIIKRYSTT